MKPWSSDRRPIAPAAILQGFAGGRAIELPGEAPPPHRASPARSGGRRGPTAIGLNVETGGPVRSVRQPVRPPSGGRHTKIPQSPMSSNSPRQSYMSAHQTRLTKREGDMSALRKDPGRDRRQPSGRAANCRGRRPQWRAVLAAARQEASLRQLAKDGAGAKVLALDATDEAAPGKVFDALWHRISVVSAGAFPPAALLHGQSWPEFAVNWETDAKTAFHFCKAALARPLPAGASVILVSSGVARAASPISGGYAGAKRTQLFIANSARRNRIDRSSACTLWRSHPGSCPTQRLESMPSRLFRLSSRIRGRLHSGHRFASECAGHRERSH